MEHFLVWAWNPRFRARILYFPYLTSWPQISNFLIKLQLKIDHFLVWAWNPRFWNWGMGQGSGGGSKTSKPSNNWKNWKNLNKNWKIIGKNWKKMENT